MNLLCINDLGTGHIQLTWQQAGALPRPYPQPLPFHDPLSAHDRAELRWYLEEYLGFPYGAERDRAAGVAGKLDSWGQALFAQLFPRGEQAPDPRAFYQEAVRAGLEQCEVCVASDDPAFLSVPWELLCDPTPGRGYLAPSLGGLYRRRSAQAIQAPPELPSAEPFRILLVIARPYGARHPPGHRGPPGAAGHPPAAPAGAARPAAPSHLRRSAGAPERPPRLLPPGAL